MISMTVKELLEATGGRLMGGSQDVNKEFTGVKTDNRECTEGDLFIAIVGEKNDAHRFIPGALEKGAAGCLISREPGSYAADRFYVLVKDTTLALGDLPYPRDRGDRQRRKDHHQGHDRGGPLRQVPCA